MRKPRWGVLVAGLLASVILLAAGTLFALTKMSRQAEILSVRSSQDGKQLEVVFGSCNADLAPFVEEEADRVVVYANGGNPILAFSREDCLDLATVGLEAQLGTRKLIDGATGREVDVLPSSDTPG